MACIALQYVGALSKQNAHETNIVGLEMANQAGKFDHESIWLVQQ